MAAQASDSHPPGQLNDSRGSLPIFHVTSAGNCRQGKIVKISRTDLHAGIASEPRKNRVPTVLVISGRLAPTSQKHLSFPNHGWLTPAGGFATCAMYKRTISATSGGRQSTVCRADVLAQALTRLFGTLPTGVLADVLAMALP